MQSNDAWAASRLRDPWGASGLMEEWPQVQLVTMHAEQADPCKVPMLREQADLKMLG